MAIGVRMVIADQFRPAFARRPVRGDQRHRIDLEMA